VDLWETVTLSNFFFQWPLELAYKKGYVLPNAIYMDGITMDGIDIGRGKSFPMQKLVVLSNLKYVLNAGTKVRDTWDDVITGRFKAAPVYFPETKLPICLDPPRVYKQNDAKCKGAVKCKTPGREGFEHNACETFPCEGPDCEARIEDGNPCQKCNCYAEGFQNCQPQKVNGVRPSGCSCYYAGVGKGCLNRGCGETECDGSNRCQPGYDCFVDLPAKFGGTRPYFDIPQFMFDELAKFGNHLRGECKAQR
jgi:hypothetical protein